MKTKDLQKLLSTMSLEEKIGELFQVPSYFFDGPHITGPAADLGITDEDLRVAGSCLSVTGAKKLRSLQEQHIKNHPHHIPMLFMADIINGYHTVFPIPLAQGCTFSPDTVEYAASVAAREAAAAGIHVTFSPMADLVQDARWGRVMESTGEDPYLNGEMAAAMVRGYQGNENQLRAKGKLAACLKHFAGYGAAQGGRDYNTAELSERTLRDDYLPAYQEAIQTGCALVMTSFNTLDRVPSTGNKKLMRDILREEMGFKGVLISDWCAVNELIAHGIAPDESTAAKLALEAGVDIDMASPVYLKNLKGLLQKNLITEAQIDECVLRVLELKNALGLFENPYKDASEEDERTLILCQDHRNTARICAEQSFVLLKNEDSLLPLNKQTESVAFIGPFADNPLLCGSWSFFGQDEDTVTVKKGMQTLWTKSNIFFAAGSPTVDPGTNVIGFQKTPPAEQIDTPEKLESALKEAVSLASKTDKVVLCLGEHREYTGECASRANLTLPDCQLRLLRQVSEVNPNICVVLFNGRPLDLREIAAHSKAILEVWWPGTEGGNAVARVLCGESSPSGKLAMSFPYCTGQVPVYYNHMNTGRPLHTDFRQGRFASQYIDIPNEPLYPFGYGLTYTEFSYSDIFLDRTQLHPGEILHASVQVTNIGQRHGTETVQLYLHDMYASVTRPVRELKGFRKVSLLPGETTEVCFSVTEEMLRFHDLQMNKTSEPGEFELYIGTDSTAPQMARFTLLSD